jgi:hypothetical protein
MAVASASAVDLPIEIEGSRRGNLRRMVYLVDSSSYE